MFRRSNARESDSDTLIINQRILLDTMAQQTGDPSAEAHYDETYFDWQRDIGEFAAMANLFKFQPHIRPTDRVLDFGCGGGYLLAALGCADKLGIEINPTAREAATRLGIRCVPTTEDVPDEWADVIVSNSALEHTEHPIGELRRLLPKLRRGGMIVFSIPHESLAWNYVPGDISQHLYTWSPMGAGNLFATAGYSIDRVWVSRIMWPPKYRQVHRVLGDPLFRAFCFAYRLFRLAISPIKVVGDDASVVVVARRP